MKILSIYDFEVESIDLEKISLKNFEGKVLLIVNTASKCGFTSQFKELEEIYQEFKDRGFEILGFPSDQFGNQELEKNEEIKNFCELNYGVSFLMFDKIKVNGKDANPLFLYLQNHQKGILGKSIKWNFTKFLIDRKGNILKRFAPSFTPVEIKPFIEKIL